MKSLSNRITKLEQSDNGVHSERKMIVQFISPDTSEEDVELIREKHKEDNLILVRFVPPEEQNHLYYMEK